MAAKSTALEVLKRISREPWWNKHSKLMVPEALSQITSLLPRASIKLISNLLDYLVTISEYDFTISILVTILLFLIAVN